MKSAAILSLIMNLVFLSAINSYGEEYEWKRVVKRSWPSSKFMKTTVKLPPDEREILDEQLKNYDECPITSDEFDELPVNSVIAKTPCNHFFCKQALLDWIEHTKQNSSKNLIMNKEPIPTICPYCLQEISDDGQDLTFYKKKIAKG